MKTNIKNYTSGIASDRSISKIEQILVELGATNISKQYKDGKLSAISFLIMVNGNTVPFKLPAKVDQVREALRRSYKRISAPALRKITEQADRTAWKIVCDWVEIQATLIRLEQAEFLEVFLPYVYKIEDDQTFFERLKTTQYKALLN
jgi:hypothetical protein